VGDINRRDQPGVVVKGVVVASPCEDDEIDVWRGDEGRSAEGDLTFGVRVGDDHALHLNTADGARRSVADQVLNLLHVRKRLERVKRCRRAEETHHLQLCEVTQPLLFRRWNGHGR